MEGRDTRTAPGVGMNLVLEIGLGWIGSSVLVALGVGPMIRRAAVLAERHESIRFAVKRPAA